MIEKNDYGIFEIFCDRCGDSVEIDTDNDWKEMIEELKDVGWKIKKDEEGEEWNHYCEECKFEI